MAETNESRPPTVPRSELWLFLSILLLTAIPILLICSFESEMGVFRFLAPDAFYYFAVAKHSQDVPFFSADGKFATNGFHPFWQWILWGLWRYLPASDPGDPLLAGFLLSGLLTAIGAGLWGLAVRRATGSFCLGLLAGVPGIFFLLFALVEPHVGSTWALVNGMETGLSVALFAGWYLLLLQPHAPHRGPPGALALSLGAAFLTLARLDEIYLFLPVFLAAVFLEDSDGPPRSAALRLGALLPAALLVAVPLLHNLLRSGMVMPVSGTVKAGFYLWQNLQAVLYTFLPVPGVVPPWEINWAGIAYRVLQLLFPVVGAILWLNGFRSSRVHWGSWREDYQKRPEVWHLSGLALYVLLKGGHHFLFTEFYHQGHWYFPLGLMMASMWLGWFLSEGGTAGWLRREGRFVVVLTAGFILLLGYAVVKEKRITDYGVPFFRLWAVREQIDATLAHLAPDSGLVEFDDSILAFSLRAPTLNAFGLTIDAEALQARRERRFLRLAWKRGFRIMASQTHLPYPPPAGSDALALDRYCRRFFFRDESWAAWRFQVLFREPKSGCTFIAFEPQGDWDSR